MGNPILKYVPKNIRSVLSNIKKTFRKKYKSSYSQAGEDLILDMILLKGKKGFYIDVGANNPYIQSNTNYFYKKGWKGINIDALPGSMEVFKRVRSRDINLEIPISNTGESLKYYMFSSSFYNSFSQEQALKYKKLLVEERVIKTEKLSDILEKYVGTNEIDFMSVDVEGMDLEVMKSNNWVKFRPRVIVTEFIKIDNVSILQTEVSKYLETKGYTFYCNSPVNCFFLESKFLQERFQFH